MIVLKNGGSTAAADRTFRNVLREFKEDRVSAVWRLDFVAASSADDGGSAAILRPVGAIGVNLGRVSAATILGERVARGEIQPADLDAAVARIDALPPPYNRWTMVAAAACTAAAFSRIPGGDWGAVGLAFVAAGVGQVLRSRLQAMKLPVAPVTLICGVLSACIAAAGLRLGISHTAPPTLIASVIYMVPGLPLINGFIDVVTQRYLFVGFERIANASFLFLVLAIAIAFAYTVVM